MLWELVESVEKDTAGLRRPMEALRARRLKDRILDPAVVRDRDDDETASSSASTMMATLSSEQLAELRAAVADTTSARVREAVEQLLGSINYRCFRRRRPFDEEFGDETRRCAVGSRGEPIGCHRRGREDVV